MAIKTRSCDACGGTGRGQYEFRPTPNILWPATPCPVCLGAGRISDVMPVSDSLADAATLFDNMVTHEPYNSFERWQLEAAAWIGLNIQRLTRDRELYEKSVGFLAESSANFAFRAVPGLKEA